MKIQIELFYFSQTNLYTYGSVTFQLGNSLPEVRVFTIKPVTVIENHFSKPVGKTDLLKAPLSFPTPVYKYTLREMTLVWHMYGGLDFKSSVPPKKHVTLHTER